VSAGPAWILVVDDDPVERRMLTHLLERDGHRVDTAADGRQALERLHAEPFDLVLLDVLMPEMDGYEVLAHLKDDDVLRHLPVLMITALDDVGSAVRCIELGADDYLLKPFDAVVLQARIRASLSKKRLHDLESQHLAELARLNRRLEARIEEQMSELVRTGELRRFLPQHVADGLLEGELEPEEAFARRKITSLFADMVGFTDLSESLEPEELALVLNDYLREMSALAVAHGGALDNFIGDGLMVVFGAPLPSQEGAQALAAVRTAFGMRDRARELAAEVRGRGIPADLQIRVGINTGHCTVGVFGSELLQSYTAIGTPINLAARLQAEAPRDGILCGFSTHALIQERVRARALSMTVRGIAGPIEAYEILEVMEDLGTRPQTGVAALTPREREVAKLAAEGHTARQISEILFIAERTVETHLARVYEKLGIHSKAHLMKRAAELSL
jgi:class 3 adenylate cyclase